MRRAEARAHMYIKTILRHLFSIEFVLSRLFHPNYRDNHSTTTTTTPKKTNFMSISVHIRCLPCVEIIRKVKKKSNEREKNENKSVSLSPVVILKTWWWIWHAGQLENLKPWSKRNSFILLKKWKRKHDRHAHFELLIEGSNLWQKQHLFNIKKNTNRLQVVAWTMSSKEWKNNVKWNVFYDSIWRF